MSPTEEQKHKDREYQTRYRARPGVRDRRLAYSRSYWRREDVKQKRNAARYGLSLQEFRALVREQQGACAICGRTDRSLGGLLCSQCNVVIGMADDKTFVLRSAARYLERDMGAK